VIPSVWFAGAVAVGLAAIARRWHRRGLRRGTASGPLPLFDLATLGALMCGAGLGGLAAAHCFGV